MKEGNIKISSENMMPIIKKWLYSDKDIFLREIVANGIDAITKLKKLISMGSAAEQDGEEYCIKIYVDKDAKTLSVEDNGIGMTEEEVEKYITQIAFSGASDFLAKYEKAGGDGIIGHFGLGFYSAYMVSDSVDIFTKSYNGSPAVHWQSDGNKKYTVEECDKAERGTKIVMHISDSEKEFLEEGKIRELVKKYCSFMPYNIYVDYKGDGKDKPLNTTLPLYAKPVKECTEEEYKEFYMPPKKPVIEHIPPMNYVAVRGQGNPNNEDGDYKKSIGMLYAISYTIKMSKLGKHKLDGYFDYVVPPLEGLWWLKDGKPFDYSRKDEFCWVSMIRLPDFVKKADFDWAVSEATIKKNMDLSSAEFFTLDEGLCVQCMYIGNYDNEPTTVNSMRTYANEQGYEFDLSGTRLHHEIYLSDPRKCAPEKLKTVIRIPIKEI